MEIPFPVRQYTKGDTTWVVEEGGEVPPGLPLPERGGREVMTTAVDVMDDASSGGAEASRPVSTSTNLDDLITRAIKEAATESGVDYDGDGETAVMPASWGRVKAQYQRR